MSDNFSFYYVTVAGVQQDTVRSLNATLRLGCGSLTRGVGNIKLDRKVPSVLAYQELFVYFSLNCFPYGGMSFDRDKARLVLSCYDVSRLEVITDFGSGVRFRFPTNPNVKKRLITDVFILKPFL